MIAPGLVREAADQRQKDVALLLQLLLQRRQRRLRRRHFGLLRQHIGSGGAADFELMAHDVELVGLRLDDVERRLDLAAQRGFRNSRRHHVRGERQIGRLELEALIFGKRLRRLDLPPLAAEDIGRIGDVHRGLEQIEDGRRAGLAECRGRELLARGGSVGVDRRQQLAGLRVKVFLGLPQRRLRRLQARVGLQRFGDQAVEFLRMKNLPPLARNVASHIELLRRATGDIDGSRCRGVGFGRIAADRRGWRRLKVGSDRARGKRQKR